MAEKEVIVTDVPLSEEKEPFTTTPKEGDVPFESENLKPKIVEDSNFKEESTKVCDLPEPEKNALQHLKQLILQALNNHEFTASLKPQESNPSQFDGEKKSEAIEEEKETVAVSAPDDDGAKTLEAIEETIVAVSSSSDHQKLDQKELDEPQQQQQQQPQVVSIWGIPLLADERTDVLLLKFLRARDYKVKDALSMIKNTVRWRNEFGIENLLEEKEEEYLQKVIFMHGFDKEGHPVCYNVYGEFQKNEVYQKTFSDEDKRQNFLRWRIQFLERSIRKLDFTPGGISTIVQVNDLNNCPGPAKWELRQATKEALQLFQDNYPEFVAKQVFINVPWWYLAVNKMISPFLTHRTKSKFVFAGPSKSAHTLLRYITAEELPVKYGGLSKEGEFETSDCVTEITLKPSAEHTVEFPVTEEGCCCVLTWEVRVVGWEVRYGAEFVPSREGSYTLIIQKPRKVSATTEDQVLCNSFKIGEPGKVLLSIHNLTSKNKKLLYRFKTKPSH